MKQIGHAFAGPFGTPPRAWFKSSLVFAALLCGTTLLCASCASSDGSPPATHASESEVSRTTAALREIEDVARAVESYLGQASDSELATVWAAARERRAADEVGPLLTAVHAGKEVDSSSPAVMAYLNAMQPLLGHLNQRFLQDKLPGPLKAAYGRISRDGNSRAEEDVQEKKKRDHCCTFYLDPASAGTGCFQVYDNDFNSFFECLGEIGSSFTISRGACDPNRCAFIDYE
jgi:hypothetical protein